MTYKDVPSGSFKRSLESCPHEWINPFTGLMNEWDISGYLQSSLAIKPSLVWSLSSYLLSCDAMVSLRLWQIIFQDHMWSVDLGAESWATDKSSFLCTWLCPWQSVIRNSKWPLHLHFCRFFYVATWFQLLPITSWVFFNI
jgi:hypothetical protein